MSRALPDHAGLSVFAVEDTSVQLVWRTPPPDGAVVTAADARVEVVGGAGPVSIVLDGLPPATGVEVRVDGRPAGGVQTLTPPPGELLARFATVSDLHVGERAFGLAPRFRERPDATTADSYPARCGRAAVAEAVAWGAERLVAKGDLTWSGRRYEWEAAAEVLAAAPVPVHATLGNHDVVPRAVDGREVLAGHGIDAPRDRPASIDVPGIRIVIGHSADDDHRFGAVHDEQRVAMVELARTAPAGAAFVTMHHYVDPLPFVSRYPSGVPRAQGQPLLRELAEAQPRTFLSFGHTHRHRRRRHHGLPATEVGSTKDFPGVWAGYAVHEGGIRQVVRRIAEPSCLAWTERTAASVLGLWGPWALGRLRWRCFSWSWDGRRGR